MRNGSKASSWRSVASLALCVFPCHDGCVAFQVERQKDVVAATSGLVAKLRRPRTGGFLAGRFLRRYRRGVFGFIGVSGKIIQRFV